MFEYISEAQDLVLSVVALMRCGGIAVEVVDGGERDCGQVGRGSRVRTRGAPAVCHLHKPPHQRRTGIVRAQSTMQQQVSPLITCKSLCNYVLRVLVRQQTLNDTDIRTIHIKIGTHKPYFGKNITILVY